MIAYLIAILSGVDTRMSDDADVKKIVTVLKPIRIESTYDQVEPFSAPAI
jgi:hypothetical protein